MSRAAAPVLVLVGIVIAGACDKVPLLAPTQSTMNLVVSTTSVPVNGSAEVIATVIEQAGTPVHNGTLVTFTSSFGALDPPEARTQGGQARTTFRAGTQSGVARIGAFSGGATAESVEVLVGGAAAEEIILRTEPGSVPQTGGTVQVIAVVSDTSGNALPGVPVVFSSDAGSLGSTSVVTDASGEARTTLTTNRQTVVRARVGTREGQATINVINLPTISLTTSTATPAVGVPVTFTVTPGTVTGGNAIQSVVLNLGDGSPPRNLGALSSATGVTHVYQSSGTYTVTATVTDTGGHTNQSSLVVVAQRSAITVSISASPSTTTVGSPVTFTIAATAAAGGPPIVSVLVTFPDGQSTTVGPGTSALTRSFSAPGTYIVTARATDAAGSQQTATTSIVVRSAFGD